MNDVHLNDMDWNGMDTTDDYDAGTGELFEFHNEVANCNQIS